MHQTLFCYTLTSQVQRTSGFHKQNHSKHAKEVSGRITWELDRETTRSSLGLPIHSKDGNPGNALCPGIRGRGNNPNRNAREDHDLRNHLSGGEPRVNDAEPRPTRRKKISRSTKKSGISTRSSQNLQQESQNQNLSARRLGSTTTRENNWKNVPHMGGTQQDNRGTRSRRIQAARYPR